MMTKFYTNVARHGNKILVREINEAGPSMYKVDYKPILFVKNDKGEKFKTMFGDPVTEVKLDSIKEAREWVEKYTGVHGFELFVIS